MQSVESADLQPTLDKHLKPIESSNSEQLDATLKHLSDKLSKLASQEYIESKFMQMVTVDLLTTKLKELEKEVKSEFKREIESVYRHVNELKTTVHTIQTTVEEFKNKVSDMESGMEKIESENKKNAMDNKALRQQLEEREFKLRVQSDEINNLEQYTRRNSVRIYGINDRNPKESPIETARTVVQLVNDKLHLSISTADIDIAHRMGRFRSDANRPIICKFISRISKHEVVKARRMLKGTAIVIREDLTLQNAKLLEKTSSHESVVAAWSDDGKILALLSNNKKVVVDSKTDFRKLASET